MRIDVISLFPELVAAVGEYGVVGRAVDQGLLQLHTWNPRMAAGNRHGSVDDRPYGGGPGMVMQGGPLQRTLQQLREQRNDHAPVIVLSPQGARFDQALAARMARGQGPILIAGRYEGIDERFIETEVDLELSLGDFVLSGGELPAMQVIDAVARLLPGVLGDDQSAAQDSFADGLLEYPHYTRPEQVAGAMPPEVLLSGDHAAIRRWRMKQALGRTWLRRPELLDDLDLSEAQQVLLREYIVESGRAGENR